MCSHVAGTLGTGVFDNITVMGGSGGAGLPVISSVTSASATVGTAFNYQITATNTPASYNATGLPASLNINTSTGLISGTPTTATAANVTISATNNSGTGTANLVLTIGNATSGLPSPWLNLDIGSVGVTGIASFGSGGIHRRRRRRGYLEHRRCFPISLPGRQRRLQHHRARGHANQHERLRKSGRNDPLRPSPPARPTR